MSYALIYMDATHLLQHPMLLFHWTKLLALFVDGIQTKQALSLGVIILCRLQPRDSPDVWKGLISACIRPPTHHILLRLLYSSDVTLRMPSIIHLKMEISQIKAYCTLPCWTFKRCSCSTQMLSWCWRIKIEFPGTIISWLFSRSVLLVNIV